MNLECTILAMRTTISDIMCTSNTHIEFKEAAHSLKSTLKAEATLPYSYSEDKLRKVPKGNTDFARFRNIEVKFNKGDDLKRERLEYIQKQENEKREKNEKRILSAIKIQKVFRGFRVRPKPSYRPKRYAGLFRNVPSNFDLSNFHAEMCNYARMFGLKPIPGLNLEFEDTLNRRRKKIKYAAVLRVQCFFRMAICRNRFRKHHKQAMLERKKRATTQLQKFGRFVIGSKLSDEKKNRLQIESAIKIQTRIRMFFAMHK
jgi:hypothetical protein